jgi:excisionase family DNA binding protein
LESTDRPLGGRRTAASHKFFTILQVAELLEVSTRTVQRWIESGKLVAHRLGGVVRISKADLDCFLQSCRDC